MNERTDERPCQAGVSIRLMSSYEGFLGHDGALRGVPSYLMKPPHHGIRLNSSLTSLTRAQALGLYTVSLTVRTDSRS